MAYNLKSLIKILHTILTPDQERWNFDHVEAQLISLLEIAASLKQILENSFLAGSPKMERLESEIRDAAHEAEDMIESHMVNQMMPESSVHPPDLEQVIQQLHSVKELVMKSMDGNQISTTSSAAAASLSPAKNTVVGLDQHLIQLMDRLTGQGSKLEIIPIVGMGGIGKTTLARTLYDDQAIVSHFDICAWTTISQDWNVREILFSLLRCIYEEVNAPYLLKMEDEELKDNIYQSFYGRRYLVVLDDMWSIDPWNCVKRCFPSNDNQSRILLTSRDSNVGKGVDSGSYQHEMNLLTKSKSWTLLYRKVFGKTKCPAELESIGRNIASHCGGLPLAIHVIGGLLSKAGRSRDVWEHVGNDVRSAIAEKDEQFSNILSLSYNHLPSYLKPCFLYMGAFPEDYKIGASRLMSLWAAEGFAEADGDEAEGYLTALVERNLLTVTEKKRNGRAKSYGMHDLLRDLCIRKAEQEKFLRVTPPTATKGSFHGLRRLSVHEHFRFQHFDDLVFSSTRSFIWRDKNSFAFLSGFFNRSRLVRVLDILGMEVDEFPTKILQLVNLRYLALSCSSHLPAYEISRFRNLQTLIVVGGMGVVDIPSEIWEMPELVCVKLKNSTMRYAGHGRRSSFFIRDKLQTISTIQLHRLLELDFFSCFPNMKGLGLDSVGFSSSMVVDLRHLQKLEKLRCSSQFPSNGHFLYNLRFPPSLRKLTLNQCAMPPELMTTLSQLQHLQVLKIRGCVLMSEEEWEATEEDEFTSLWLLSLEDLDMVRWRADETNFPRLRHLIIKECYALEEIPCGIGEIPTLQLIELSGCSHSVVASAKQIIEVQQSEYDNYDLQLLLS